MSYLDAPRLHFAGIFIANPSTVNNVPSNYDPAVTNPDPGWNPNGNAQWAIKNCIVTAAIYSDGTVCNTPAEDPIVGAPVAGANTGASAKLVDLDPEQQMVSEIWGFKVQLGASSSVDSFTGDFEIAAFTDIWFRATAGGSAGDAPMGASYQSVLNAVKWSASLNSPFLKQLQQTSADELSIKFNLDGINMDSSSAEFTQGRIVGTIGPAKHGEPKHFVAGRLLRSAPGTDPSIQPMTLQGTPAGAPMFFAPCQVDDGRKSVLLDVGNSISTTTPGGPMNPALGDLRLAILPPYAAPVLLGQIKYLDKDWYQNSAGVSEFPLTPSQLAMVNNTPLGIVQTGSSGQISRPLLQENATGSFVRADRFVFRLNPGEDARVDLVARRFGKPAVNEQISLTQDPMLINNMQSPPNPDNIPIGVPSGALQFPATVTTNAEGGASVILSASDPGNPRGFIDGQVYGVAYSFASDAKANYSYNPDPTSFISVLVFNSYPEVASPTWTDVKPILSQYAKLYPFMTTGVGINLANYTSVQQNLSAIRQVLMLPKENPGYMQVTRDLSRDKAELILKWIDLGAPLDPSDTLELVLQWVNLNAS